MGSSAEPGRKAKQGGAGWVAANQLWLFDLPPCDEPQQAEAKRARRKPKRRAAGSAIKPTQLSLFVSASP
jgi:hypothetical protein